MGNIGTVYSILSVVSPGFVKGMGGTSISIFFKGRGGNNDFQGTTLRH